MGYQIQRLLFYPVKGFAGMDANHFELTERGITDNARWMVVAGDGSFRNQKYLPQMCRVRPEVNNMALFLHHEKMTTLVVSRSQESELEEVSLRNIALPVRACPHYVNTWINAAIGGEYYLRMVQLDEQAANRRTSDGKAVINMEDSSPILICSNPSLAALSRGAGFPVPQERFRANIWIDNCNPREEDKWQRIKIGNVILESRKPCVRCSVINVNHRTGKFDTDLPTGGLLKFLANSCGAKKQPTFGSYFYQAAPYGGSISTADTVEVLEYKDS